MNVTKEGIKYRQLRLEDYLQMVSAEQKEYAEAYASSRITENNITNMSKGNLLEKILDRNNLDFYHISKKTTKY
ncbi:MAG: hypothetical protein RR448_11230 [Niameybacter sp.]|uniref:hypothetical protein n=1 Tax=Niameybacter sp. TaxID=2033640 RepID=UPI002FC6AFAD